MMLRTTGEGKTPLDTRIGRLSDFSVTTAAELAQPSFIETKQLCPTAIVGHRLFLSIAIIGGKIFREFWTFSETRNPFLSGTRMHGTELP